MQTTQESETVESVESVLRAMREETAEMSRMFAAVAEAQRRRRRAKAKSFLVHGWLWVSALLVISGMYWLTASPPPFAWACHTMGVLACGMLLRGAWEGGR